MECSSLSAKTPKFNHTRCALGLGTALRTQKGETRGRAMRICSFGYAFLFSRRKRQQVDRPRSPLARLQPQHQPSKKADAKPPALQAIRRAAARCREASSPIATTDWSDCDAIVNGLPSSPGESRTKKSPRAAARTPVPFGTPGLSDPPECQDPAIDLVHRQSRSSLVSNKKANGRPFVDQRGGNVAASRVGHCWALRVPPSSLLLSMDELASEAIKHLSPEQSPPPRKPTSHTSWAVRQYGNVTVALQLGGGERITASRVCVTTKEQRVWHLQDRASDAAPSPPRMGNQVPQFECGSGFATRKQGIGSAHQAQPFAAAAVDPFYTMVAHPPPSRPLEFLCKARPPPSTPSQLRQPRRPRCKK